jgi:hypothetical protein
MSSPSSWPQLVFWKQGDRRCEMWMKGGIPELRIYVGDVLLYKEVTSLEALYDRAEQLRAAQPNEG